MSSYQVIVQPLGDFATNAYLLIHNETAIAIDAPPKAFEFYQNIVKDRGLSFNYLLLTHSHFDHIADAALIQKEGVKVGIHSLDKGNCIKPGSDGLPLVIPVEPFVPDFTLDESFLEVDGFKFEILHTPGHTPGGCCFMIDNLMFSGDTLFKGSIGNLSFTTANTHLMQESLKKLLEIKINYTVYPGHGPKTELFQEHKTLIYFQKSIG
jgi:glyoxylase-like metal-dependent hydrolase (beta-lactamase superfamily II)